MNPSASRRPPGPATDVPTGVGGASPGAAAGQPWRAWSPGIRVVVRRRLPAGDDHLYTDVLGELTAVDATGVVVLTRHGSVGVAADEIVLTKIVPPAPIRRSRSGRSEPEQ